MATPKRTPKPKGKTFRLRHTTETMARALIDAEFHGDKRAAKLHGTTFRAIENWRAAARPEVSAEIARLKRQIGKGWLDRARMVRIKALDAVAEKLSTSPSLTARVEALRRVHEVVISTEVLSDDDQPLLPDQPADPGEAEGEG